MASATAASLQPVRSPDIVIYCTPHHKSKKNPGRAVVASTSPAGQRGETLRLPRPQRVRQDTTIRMLCGLLTPDGGEGNCLG